jgi:hypothetical protein
VGCQVGCHSTLHAGVVPPGIVPKVLFPFGIAHMGQKGDTLPDTPDTLAGSRWELIENNLPGRCSWPTSSTRNEVFSYTKSSTSIGFLLIILFLFRVPPAVRLAGEILS